MGALLENVDQLQLLELAAILLPAAEETVEGHPNPPRRASELAVQNALHLAAELDGMIENPHRYDWPVRGVLERLRAQGLRRGFR